MDQNHAGGFIVLTHIEVRLGKMFTPLPLNPNILKDVKDFIGFRIIDF